MGPLYVCTLCIWICIYVYIYNFMNSYGCTYMFLICTHEMIAALFQRLFYGPFKTQKNTEVSSLSQGEIMWDS